MAGTEVGSLFYDLNIDDANLNKTLDSADKKVADFGKNVSDAGDKLASGMKKTAAGLAVVGAGITLVAKNATDFTVDLVKSSTTLGRQIGVTTEEASRLTAAFTRMGLAGDSVQQMFGIFSKNIVAATQNADKNKLANESLQISIDKTKASISQTTEEIKKNGDKSGDLGLKIRDLNNQLATQQKKLGESTDAFAKLGVSTVDANGKQRDFTSILFDVADKFQKLPNGIDKTATAMELFGRSGKDMIKVLNLGSSGIQELEKEADRLGLTLNANTISQINDLVQSQKDLKQQTDAMKIAIGTATAPVLTEFNKRINEMLQGLVDSSGPLRTITVDFLAFSGPVFVGASAVLAFGANLVTMWPAVVRTAAAIRDFTVAQTALDTALWANPIALLIAAIVALGVAIYESIAHFQEMGAVSAGVMDWVAMKINGAYMAMSAFGASMIDWFTMLPGRIAGALSSLGNMITAPFRAAFQDVVNLWNNSVGKIHFTAPSWVPGVGGKGWSFPKFAEGAIATGPTLGMFGEAGTEAVLPLSFLDRYNTLFDRIETTANKLTGTGPQSMGDTIINIGEIHNQAGEDWVLRRLDRNGELESMGASPAYGGGN